MKGTSTVAAVPSNVPRAHCQPNVAVAAAKW